MWLTFRQMRVSQRRATSGPGVKPDLGWRQKRFKWYALYSWGCPFLISMVTGELALRGNDSLTTTTVQTIKTIQYLLNRRLNTKDLRACYVRLHSFLRRVPLGISYLTEMQIRQSTSLPR